MTGTKFTDLRTDHTINWLTIKGCNRTHQASTAKWFRVFTMRKWAQDSVDLSSNIINIRPKTLHPEKRGVALYSWIRKYL